MIRRILILYRFTVSEQRSLVFLCALLVLVNGLSFVINRAQNRTCPIIDLSEEDLVKSPHREGAEAVVFSGSDPIVQQTARKRLIEINASDSAALISLYGIGPVFAGRIVKYRELLGGYCRCGQLLEVYGMDSIRYQGFRDNVHVDTSLIEKLDINTAGFKELLRHPYINYENVKLIVNYRDRAGPLTSPLDLWRDSVLGGDIRMKLLPYLE